MELFPIKILKLIQKLREGAVPVSVYIGKTLADTQEF